jgi:hypothetical protein
MTPFSDDALLNQLKARVMRSGSPDDIDDSSAPRRNVAVPVACSVLLHVALFALIARAAFAPSAEARIPDERPSVRVSMVVRPPPPVPAAVIPQSPAPVETLSEEELTESGEVAPREETADLEVPAIANSPPADASASAADEEISDGDDDSVRAWTPTAVRVAIGAYVSNQRNTQIETWVASCILEQKTEHTRDCERQRQASDGTSASAQAGRIAGGAAFGGVTRPMRHALLTEGFTETKDAMKELMDVPGVLGQMATDRYYLSREYIYYLNGNPSPYGPRNQFNCAGIGPCIYEYTGFVIERPEREVDPNEFRVVPTLLGGSR